MVLRMSSVCAVVAVFSIECYITVFVGYMLLGFNITPLFICALLVVLLLIQRI